MKERRQECGPQDTFVHFFGRLVSSLLSFSSSTYPLTTHKTTHPLLLLSSPSPYWIC